ncbi:hypothetical protein J007_06064 [Cryptococcus neoformans]|nr:hypothetical protein C356_06146 [Cryptococcus neoformans var. grubii c45]OXB34311.1 hypothetical protein J007_06064 [Cryptococcus neoformans var. grubii]OXC58474.1 hypothetical protein C358_06154 [Cryptococcus neoformans var. grubii MW-RSA852]
MPHNSKERLRLQFATKDLR